MCCFLDNHKRMQSQSFNSCGRKSRPSSQHQDLSIREKDEKKYKNYKNVCIQPQMIVLCIKNKAGKCKSRVWSWLGFFIFHHHCWSIRSLAWSVTLSLASVTFFKDHFSINMSLPVAKKFFTVPHNSSLKCVRLLWRIISPFLTLILVRNRMFFVFFLICRCRVYFWILF